jgi:hypothetical protein
MGEFLTDLRRLASHPLAPLLLFSVLASALFATYVFAGRAPSLTFEAVVQLGWGLLLAFWVVVDARAGHRIPCFDFGLFCYLLLPITLPWYCFWSRGWRGFLLLAALYGLGIAPYIVQSISWELLYGTA